MATVWQVGALRLEWCGGSWRDRAASARRRALAPDFREEEPAEGLGGPVASVGGEVVQDAPVVLLLSTAQRQGERRDVVAPTPDPADALHRVEYGEGFEAVGENVRRTGHRQPELVQGGRVGAMQRFRCRPVVPFPFPGCLVDNQSLEDDGLLDPPVTVVEDEDALLSIPLLPAEHGGSELASAYGQFGRVGEERRPVARKERCGQEGGRLTG